MTKHPMQPIEYAEDGVIRFKGNAIIDYLQKTGKLDLNEVMAMPFSDEDKMQIAQLLSYSTSGFGDLSYASKKVVKKADKIAAKLYREKHKP